MILKIVNNM